MKRIYLLILFLLLAACGAPGPTPQPTQELRGAVTDSAPTPGAGCVQVGTVAGRVLWWGDCMAVSVPVTATVTATATAVVPYPGPGTDTPVPSTVTLALPADTDTPVLTETPAPAASETPAPASETVAPETETPPPTFLPSETPSITPSPTTTPPGPTATEFPTATPIPPGAVFTPWPSAPLCQDSGEFHDTGKFHTLWNASAGCHYNHEHGTDPFTAQVAQTFPGYDLKALGCGLEVNHCSPSSSRENTWDGKHTGWKVDVALNSYLGCAGFEGVPTGIDAAVVGYHTFSDYSDELSGRIHSVMLMGREVRCSAPNDYGYIYVVQMNDYGQRTIPYQGDIMAYPDNPPPYDSPRGPYISIDCVGQKAAGELGACRSSRQFVLDRNANTNSIWTSKPTGGGAAAVAGSKIFNLLFRLRDTMQLLVWSDQTYPFTFTYLCSLDGGLTYAALPGCRYNSSTSKVQEIAVNLPAVWDNVPGLDTDPREGRLTIDTFVTRFGDLAPAAICLQPGATCLRMKLVNAFVGKAGSQLIDGKFPQFSPEGQPERDIYFCGSLPCGELSPGARAAGWIGPVN
jgi:hypothetical protein